MLVVRSRRMGTLLSVGVLDVRVIVSYMVLVPIDEKVGRSRETINGAMDVDVGKTVVEIIRDEKVVIDVI